jgi:hypothetical protein
MKNRSADATLLGFYYQFDKTIHTILEQVDENNIITIEGIEDVDIKTINEESVIQIKYQAETNGTDSVLRKPIMLMLEHFKNYQSQNLKYHLYGHYKNNNNVKTTFDFTRIQKMMQYKQTIKGKKVQFDFLADKSISQQEVDNFLKKFKLILSDAFDEHQKKTYLKIKSDFNITNDEEVNFLYNNALKIVNDLAIQKNINKRKITKKDFKNKINTKDSLFNIWFVQLKGIETYCKAIHKKYFASCLNTTKKERFFILPNESIENLKKIIYTIEEKFYKLTTRGITSEAPYIFIKGLSKNDLISLKKSIYGESKIINDGIAFFGADFQIKELFKPSTLENKISIKFINEENYLNNVLASTLSTKEIYQFYFDKKDIINIEDIVSIQIQNSDNIHQIIKGK